MQKVQVSNFEFPKCLSYDNPLVGFVHKTGGTPGFNFVTKTGKKSQLPYTMYGNPESSYTTVTTEEPISKVEMWGDENHLAFGFKFYNASQQCILEAGLCADFLVMRHFTL